MPTIEELAEAVTEADRNLRAAKASGERNIAAFEQAVEDAQQAYDDAALEQEGAL